MPNTYNPATGKSLTSFGTSQSGPIPGGYGVGGHQKRSVVGYIEDLAPYDTPLIKLFGYDKEQDQPTIEWLTGADVGHNTVLQTSINTSDTSVVVASGDGPKVQVYQTIAVYQRDANYEPLFSSRELMWVTARSGDTLTVVRAQGGTTAGSFTGGVGTAGAYIEILASAVPEGEDFVTTPNTYGTWYKNYFQLIQKGKRITEEANVTPDWEFQNTPHIARLMKKAGMEAKRELEKSIVQGGAQLGTNASGSSMRPSMMSGINDFIVQGGHVTNLTGNVLTIDDIENEGAALWDTVADEGASKLLMNMKTARMLDAAFMRFRTNGDLNASKLNTVFSQFETRFGVFEIVPTRWVPSGVVFGVNAENIKIVPYKGMNWTEKEHSTDGAYMWRSFYGKFSLKVLAPEAMFKLHSFDTDPNNYGRYTG